MVSSWELMAMDSLTVSIVAEEVEVVMLCSG